MPASPARQPCVAVVGGGPAGLMAAEAARAAGAQVDLYEGKGSVGRKFLIAGRGGLNLTHSEPRPAFDARYGPRRAEVGAWLDAMDADAVRAWARDLGVDTFAGSSGRVFPLDRKAAPLLRAWVQRLRESGVRFHVHHRWLGWDDADTAVGALRFATPEGEARACADAVVLALGGGSWPQLGSDGAWQALLRARGVEVAPLEASNCGFDVAWSDFFRTRHAGAPLKHVVAYWRDARGEARSRQGVKVALLHEVLDKPRLADPAQLAAAIKRLPLRLLRPRPIAEAISSAGGVRLEALDAGLMCRALPGVFCAGEMLDWDAPTGGYLLTASLASGLVAGRAAARRALATGTCQTA
jgi:predicted flavoprotein YhiN